jgi:hypothetical protein
MECTHCTSCNDTILQNVCPNCGGNLTPRPIRPQGEYRPGEGLTHNPAGTTIKRTRYSMEQIRALTAQLKNVPPEKR